MPIEEEKRNEIKNKNKFHTGFNAAPALTEKADVIPIIIRTNANGCSYVKLFVRLDDENQLWILIRLLFCLLGKENLFFWNKIKFLSLIMICVSEIYLRYSIELIERFANENEVND